jgi:hypothetical protein
MDDPKQWNRKQYHQNYQQHEKSVVSLRRLISIARLKNVGQGEIVSIEVNITFEKKKII